ncbi:MAG: ABC transporter ATP-binding protein [Candidatus Hodarchaeales archaeon]|jgi:ABC-2 type transport system ATP-binding protein
MKKAIFIADNLQNKASSFIGTINKREKINIKDHEYMIELDHVTKFYKPEVVAVSDATVRIPRNSIVGFLGPNGSGKSTILKTLVGELRPSLGKVQVYGQNPWNNPDLRQHVGYISEIEGFFEWMSPEKFLYWMAKFSLTSEEAKKRVEESLEIVEMLEHKNKPIGTFSKGMRQRIRVALALLKPDLKLIIADEPLSGLDPRSRNDMYRLFKHLHNDLEVDVFVSSHILFEIERITKYIVLIYNGQIIALGKTKEIRNLLSEYPYKFEIVTDKARELLKVILDSSLDILGAEELNLKTTTTQSFVVSTKKPNEFYDTLPSLCLENDIMLFKLVNLEEDIETETIFKYLVNP